jgi:hypothetical protein
MAIRSGATASSKLPPIVPAKLVLSLTFKRPLPGDDLNVFALPRPALDPVAPGDRAVGVEDACQSLLELGHKVLGVLIKKKTENLAAGRAGQKGLWST